MEHWRNSCWREQKSDAAWRCRCACGVPRPPPRSADGPKPEMRVLQKSVSRAKVPSNLSDFHIISIKSYQLHYIHHIDYHFLLINQVKHVGFQLNNHKMDIQQSLELKSMNFHQKVIHIHSKHKIMDIMTTKTHSPIANASPSVIRASPRQPLTYSRWTKHSNPGKLYPPRPSNFKVVFFFQGLTRVDKRNLTLQHDMSRTLCLTLTFGDGGVMPIFSSGFEYFVHLWYHRHSLHSVHLPDLSAFLARITQPKESSLQ